MRLSGRREFGAVFGTKARVSAGPLLIYSRPNDLPHPRLGLSVSRRVGSAVKRNLINRRLREAFRLTQHDWPSQGAGYDLVISVRPHEPLHVAEYQQALMKAMRSIHSTWSKKLDKKNRNTSTTQTTPRDTSA